MNPAVRKYMSELGKKRAKQITSKERSQWAKKAWEKIPKKERSKIMSERAKKAWGKRKK